MAAAEEAAYGGTDLERRWRLDELRTLARQVTDGPWWRHADGPVVEIGAARTGAHSSSATSTRPALAPGHVTVRLADGQRDVATVAHELAHALAGVGHGHDARFRAATIDIVAVLAGRPSASALNDSYRAFGLDVAARPWPAPVRGSGDGFVMVP